MNYWSTCVHKTQLLAILLKLSGPFLDYKMKTSHKKEKKKIKICPLNVIIIIQKPPNIYWWWSSHHYHYYQHQKTRTKSTLFFPPILFLSMLEQLQFFIFFTKKKNSCLPLQIPSQIEFSIQELLLFSSTFPSILSLSLSIHKKHIKEEPFLVFIPCDHYI